MSIREFHSSLQMDGESDALLDALRLLNTADAAAVSGEAHNQPGALGWDPWAAGIDS